MTRKGHLPPRVYLRHGRYYLVTLPDRKWVPLTREREGLPAMYRAYAELVDRDTTRDLMPAVITRWADSKRPEWASSTMRDMDRLTVIMAQAFSDFSPGQVTTPVCAEYLQRFKATPRTANMHRSILRQVLAYAAVEGLREGHNPVDNIPQARLQARRRAVSDTEIAAIKAAALQGRFGHGLVRMIDLALITGQRVGDLLDLQWDQITDAGIQLEQGKTGERLLIEWSPALRAAIDACERDGERIGHVLRTESGRRYRYSGIRSAWVRACARAGIVDLHIHDLRGRAGMDQRDALGLESAKALLGHRSIRMTEVYVDGKAARKVRPAR